MSTKKIIIAGGAVVLIAGIVFFYIRHKKAMAKAISAPAPSPATAGAPSAAPGATQGPLPATAPETGDPVRNALLTRYTSLNKPKEVAAINSADPETIRLWGVVVQFWNSGADPYKYDIYGAPTGDYYKSIGEWWESYSARKGF